MAKLKFLLMSVALLVLGSVQLYAAKELKLVARYNYSPDGQLQSVLTPVSDNGAVKTSYSRSYLSDGKVKVTVHKKNLEFNELAFVPSFNGQGLALVAPADDRGSRWESERSLAFSSPYHDYNEAFALYQVASKGDVVPTGLDKGILVREYIEKAGRKLEETDMLGNTSKYHYNKLGQLVKVSSFAEGNEVSNGAGRALPVPSGGTAGRSESETSFSTSFSYDKYGRLDKTQDALGRVSGRVYDPDGRVAQMINPLDEKSFVNYDKYGRVASRSGAGGYPLSFEYNSFGEIIAYTDGNGSKTKFEYDIAGRLVKRIWPDGTPVTYSYNDRGLLSQKLEGNRTTVYSYDTMNRLAKILIEDASASQGRARLAETASNGGSSSTSTAVIDRQSSTTLLSYSSTDKLISIADESGKIEFAYDSFGRVTSETGEIGVIKYEYNNIGLLSARECLFSRNDATTQSFKTTYSYDNFDRITQVTSPAGTYSYKYDNKGRVASLAFGDVTVKTEYDKAGRLTAKKMNDTVLCSYDYDKLDRRVKAEVNGVKWVYGYDNFNQLTSASSSDGYIYGYDFDTIGNRKFASLMEKGTEKFKTDFEYNGLNQIAKQGFQYDAYGNLIQANDTKYSYDLHNRLTEVKKGNIRCEFAYDAFSRRIQKRIFTDGKLTKHLKFAYSGFNCIGEIDASSGKVLMNYVWNNNELLGAVDNESKSYSYLTDGNRNIIKILDSNRNSAAEYSYSPFSEQIKFSGDFAEKNPFRFSSEYFDSETGLVYYNFRYYSPEIGRWISKDPIRERGGINIYAFVNNSSIDYFDFLGAVGISGGTASGKVNCLGYAMTGKYNEYLSPKNDLNPKDSFIDAMKKQNWDCKKVTNKDECKCECDEVKILITLYQDNPVNKDKDPWTDPTFIFGRTDTGLADIHAVRAEPGNSNDYTQVPHIYILSEEKPIINNSDIKWSLFENTPLLCCCK